MKAVTLFPIDSNTHCFMLLLLLSPSSISQMLTLPDHADAGDAMQSFPSPAPLNSTPATVSIHDEAPLSV